MRLYENDEKAEAVEKICNDFNLFIKYFKEIKPLLEEEAYFGDDLWDFVKEENWLAGCVFDTALDAIDNNDKNNKPLANGDFHCYFSISKNEPYPEIATFYDQKSLYKNLNNYSFSCEIWEKDLSRISDKVLKVLD